jgi:hypothetical protein
MDCMAIRHTSNRKAAYTADTRRGENRNLQRNLMSDEFGQTAILKEPRAAQQSDLSHQIEQSVGREARDRVKCVRVYNDFYRCNWWALPVGTAPSIHGSPWDVIATQRVRKSSFLRVTLVEGKLLIQEIVSNCP